MGPESGENLEQQQTLKVFKDIVAMKAQFIGKELTISIPSARATEKIKDIYMSENSRLLIIEGNGGIKFNLPFWNSKVLANKDGSFSIKSDVRTFSVSK